MLRVLTPVLCAAPLYRASRHALCLAVLLAATFLPNVLFAATVRYRTDAELVVLSDRVVYGRVIDQRTTRLEGSGTIYTVSTIAVIEDLTGRPGDTVEVWELGGVVGNEFMYVGGAVEYALGGDVLVFLERSPRGLRSAAMGFSKFDVIGRTGRNTGRLVRGMKDTEVVGGPASRSERSLDDFRALAESITGRRSRRAQAAALLEGQANVVQSFTTLGNLRWTQADTGTPVVWYLNASAPAPTAPSDAVSDTLTALAAWTNPSSASIVLQYGGTTLQNQPEDSTGDADGPWVGISSTGMGVITFEDPNDEMSSSTLALGGGYGDDAPGGGGTVNGTTFTRFLRGFVMFQNAADLSPSFKQSQNFTRVLTHEIGHAIGLGHTPNDGSVANAQSNIMFASCCSALTPVPPALGPDDLAGLNFIYPVGASCTFSVSPSAATYTTAASGGTVGVITAAGCAWTATSSTSFVSITGGASGTGNGTVTYKVSATSGLTQRTATLSIAGQAVTITQAGTGPLVTLDTSALQFSATSNGAAFTSQTAAQTVRLTQTGGSGTVTWTASSNESWLVVSPASGSGTATLTVSVVFSNALPTSGTANGSITLALTGAGNAAGPVSVTFTTVQAGASTLPFGFIDTPLDNAAGVTGSVPVTGWALDDDEVASVKIYRDPVAGERAGSLVFIGDAVFVEGARPDVAAANPKTPLNTRTGWGYLLLTNVLPNQGNGTFRLHVYAVDRDLGQTLLGSRTITCSNSTSTAPFGAIDTPAQGQTVSGSVNNFGWVLVPGTARADVPGGGTVVVVIDGAVVGVPGQWTSRSDISTVFPTGFSSLASTLAVHTFDTTTLSNGVHTIAWVVTANNGQGAGIGSRYFTVSNGAAGSVLGSVRLQAERDPGSVRLQPDHDSSVRLQADQAPLDRRSISGRRGFNLEIPYRAYRAGTDGRITVQSEEIDRIELRLSEDDVHKYSGYMRVGNALGPLPTGSQLDASTGVFTWQPGVGFVGPYDFVFVRCDGSPEGLRYGSVEPGSVDPGSVDPGSVAQPFRAAVPARCHRQEIRIVLNPKASGRVGPQVIIDIPTRQQDVGQPFVIAGWAVDLDQAFGSGIDAVHVWAYPLTGADPVFLGAAHYGGARPDVAAIYGDRFTSSGYGLTVEGLTPGNYDLAVFGWSTATGGFAPAKTVRITVR